MRRISDELFLATKPDRSKVIGIRVKDGEFYFLASMSNAPDYKIQKAKDPDGYLLDRSALIINGDILFSIQASEDCKNMRLLYQTNDVGYLIDEKEAEQYADEYEEFLSLIKCYEKDGESYSEDHDILVLSKEELSSFCDILRDGDYILVIED